MMHAPIKKFNVQMYPKGNLTQGFGENPRLYRPWGLEGHNGQDYVAPYGTDLLAVEDGQVIDVNYSEDGFGKYIRILSDYQDELGHRREWTYGHLSAIRVVVGERVQAGEKVGEMGNTGFVVSGSTPFWQHNPYAGTHLHLGLRKAYLAEDGFRYSSKSPRIRIVNYYNGYKGAIDPAPLFTLKTQSPATTTQLLTLLSLINQVVALLNKIKKDESNRRV